MLARCFAIVVMLLASSTVLAQITVVPSIGLGIEGQVSVDYLSVSNAKITGTPLNFKVGYTAGSAFFGLEYSNLINGEIKDLDPDTDYGVNAIGLFGSYVVFPNFTTYGGYFFDYRAIVKRNTVGFQSDLYGTDTYVGVSYEVQPKLSISLEYHIMEIDYINTSTSGKVFAAGSGSQVIFGVSYLIGSK